jgi:hypothetical protein
VRVAIAGTRTTARLLVRHRAGLSIVEPGDDAQALAHLPLELLLQVRPPDDADAEICASFRRWGLRTLGDVAALPPADVAARMGQAGVQWQRLARGEDPAPLVPSVPEERFEQALDLEWPIEGLEPLSFVLGRLMEPLSAHLERRDRGAAVLHVRLHLVSKAVHARAARRRVASARGRHRPRGGGRGPDPRARSPVLAADASAAVARAGVHADGAARRIDRRRPLWSAGVGGLLEARRLRYAPLLAS